MDEIVRIAVLNSRLWCDVDGGTGLLLDFLKELAAELTEHRAEELFVRQVIETVKTMDKEPR